MKKKPMNGADFFDKICDLIEAKGKMPGILDYHKSDNWEGERTITTDEFDITNSLAYGGSEGIYLDVGLYFYGGSEDEGRAHIGTFKTLDESDEAMRTMGVLLADFIIEAGGYVRENPDEFVFEGYRVRAYSKDGKPVPFSMILQTLERAEEEKDKLLVRHFRVSIIDNSTGEIREYFQE